jgi:putative endonuclease
VNRGQAAEQAALEYLSRAGLTLVARNWRCRQGEIDLIMRDGDTLVFVEVRQRSSPGFGGAAASIGQAKQQRLLRSAQHYLQTLPSVPPCRFDAICFDGERRSWLKNCLEAG